jgi:hypothetical protein
MAESKFASMSMQERIEEVRPAVASIVAKMADEGAALVTLRDDAFALLVSSKLMSVVKLHCMEIGFHPLNRGGAGIDPSEVIRKVLAFARVGFSMKEADNGCVVESTSSAFEQANREIIRISGGMLAPVAFRGQLKFFTLTTSHTNQALRAIHGELKSSDPSIAVDGKISRALLERDHRLKTVLAEGLDYKVIPDAVAVAFPQLVELIMAADNVPQALSHSDSPCAQMLNMSRLAAMQITSDASGCIDWSAIIRHVGLTAPPNIRDLPALAKFTELWSGGARGSVAVART